jgi:hypothetical protein
VDRTKESSDVRITRRAILSESIDCIGRIQMKDIIAAKARICGNILGTTEAVCIRRVAPHLVLLGCERRERIATRPSSEECQDADRIALLAEGEDLPAAGKHAIVEMGRKYNVTVHWFDDTQF